MLAESHKTFLHQRLTDEQRGGNGRFEGGSVAADLNPFFEGALGTVVVRTIPKQGFTVRIFRPTILIQNSTIGNVLLGPIGLKS